MSGIEVEVNIHAHHILFVRLSLNNDVKAGTGVDGPCGWRQCQVYHTSYLLSLCHIRR